MAKGSEVLPTQCQLVISLLIFLHKLHAKMGLWVFSWLISDVVDCTTPDEYLDSG